MVNRRYLRTKVMQSLFAFMMNSDSDFIVYRKNLDLSIQQCYLLFINLFSIFPDLKSYRLNKIEDLKQKVNPSYSDLNPNTKFVNNRVIIIIEENETLKKLWHKNKINLFANNKDILAQIFQEISQSDYYNEYMNSSVDSFEEDSKLLLNIIKHSFATSTLLHWFLEEKNIYWYDDFNVALLMLYQNISFFKENKDNNNHISPLFKNSEDIKFYQDLFDKTIFNDKEYDEIIENKLQNWELERMINIDAIALKMAICELTEFPQIPVKVIINEYIELVKTYSSPKSGFFINGILEQIIATLKENNKIHKEGRGLIND